MRALLLAGCVVAGFMYAIHHHRSGAPGAGIGAAVGFGLFLAYWGALYAIDHLRGRRR